MLDGKRKSLRFSEWVRPAIRFTLSVESDEEEGLEWTRQVHYRIQNSKIDITGELDGALDRMGRRMFESSSYEDTCHDSIRPTISSRQNDYAKEPGD